ncbi:MAG: ribonuclease catalytic domain-containing protein, partial [Deltaproteobacteria bacterium]|nr:ribonuclease catalytic domain-containing protein [Deltaproteobacteria bacterium]
LGTLNKLSEHPSSIYMPDMIVHMFKEHLATEVFSLKENHRKRALRISATFDENFSLKYYSVDFVILQVSKNLTYEVFEGLLRNKYSELLKLISALKKHRESNGALEIRRMEVIPVVSSDGKIKLKTYQKTKAHETIEELMILSNVLAAKYLIDNEIPGIFRYQTIFDKKICEEALKVQNLFVRNYKLRTTLPKSEFTVEPKPHNGLGVAYYCQITSPIRRFFDLLCQFQVWLKHMGKQPLSHSDLKRFISIASPNLEAFLAVQRNSKRFYTLRYLEQEKITHLRGIPVQKLNQGYIFEVLDYDLTCLVQTSKHFDLGEEVKLKIESLNPERLNIFLSAV